MNKLKDGKKSKAILVVVIKLDWNLRQMENEVN